MRDEIVLIGMMITVISSIATITSYVLSQTTPELFEGVMYFCLFLAFNGIVIVAVGCLMIPFEGKKNEQKPYN